MHRYYTLILGRSANPWINSPVIVNIYYPSKIIEKYLMACFYFNVFPKRYI